MDPEKLFEMFDRCLQLAEHGPPESRAKFTQIAAQVLRLANSIESMCEPTLYAPTSRTLQ